MAFIAYGQLIQSDVPLLPDSVDGAAGFADLSLRAAEPSAWPGDLRHASQPVSMHGRETVIQSSAPFGDPAPSQTWRIRVEGMLEFQWQTGGDIVEYRYLGSPDPQRLAFWFLHLVLPLLLELRRSQLLLHAGAVVLDGRAVLFLAPTNTGKSTLVRAFQRQGVLPLADDKIALHVSAGQWQAVAAHGHIRDYRAFEDLGARRFEVTRDSYPVSAAYRLTPAPPSAPVVTRQLSGAEKFDELNRHRLYSAFLPASETLENLADLASGLALSSIGYPRSLERIGEVVETIREQAGRPSSLSPERSHA